MTTSRYCSLALLLAALLAAGCRSSESTGSASARASATASAATAGGETATSAGEMRWFRFTYAATIDGLEPRARARIWLPVAQSTPEQKVMRSVIHLPGAVRETAEPVFGNALLYLEARADDHGEIPLEVQYIVQRRKARPAKAAPDARQNQDLFLRSSTMVPVDGSMLAALVGDEKPAGDRTAMARALYDAVLARMDYAKPAGEPWGRGDARWACDAGFGNCTDFHSLFIAACRDLNIPARFEIGFPIPTRRGAGEVGGYHCWAWFLADDRWVPVDISEADKHPEMKDYYFGNLTADRVMFTTGRDLQLDPPPDAGPVNFLIYPYVEVDGHRHDKITKRFRYEDLR